MRDKPIRMVSMDLADTPMGLDIAMLVGGRMTNFMETLELTVTEF